MAVQVTGEIVSNTKAGEYHVLTMTGQGIPEEAKPGQFVALSVGGPLGSTLLRRAFSIYRAQTRGAYGGTVDIVVAPHGPGTDWLADRQRGDRVNIIGPLGKPFALPRDPVPCVLVGGGYGAAPLFSLADALIQRGCRVDVILGASGQGKLFGIVDARRVASTLSITTDDGSVGTKGVVTDLLPRVIDRANSAVVYACGPMGMLKAVTAVAKEHGAHSQTAVEEAMACGIGVCMTCVLPVIGDDGETRMVRSCVEGPCFHGDRVRWDEVHTVPADTVGAPVGGGE